VNWRGADGYGTTIAACGETLPFALGCPVQRIDHSAKRLKIETPQGVITADQAIISLPTAVLAESGRLFTPAGRKIEAAQGLPLDWRDKLVLVR
jgi:monoamine oxidase